MGTFIQKAGGNTGAEGVGGMERYRTKLKEIPPQT